MNEENNDTNNKHLAISFSRSICVSVLLDEIHHKVVLAVKDSLKLSQCNC